ncbi:MAG: universal stress protein [Anaerolineales bacterium]|nr:universal stress protein [Anaerolineales bacterium]
MTDPNLAPEHDPQPTEPAHLDKAQALSRRWGERLDKFDLPCPLCRGKLAFHGMSPDRLYEFAEGEPGVVEPHAVFALSFLCDRCGYAAEFDAELFNPAYLATLAGADHEHVAELSLREYRIMVPLRGAPRSDTLLGLATATAGGRAGEVVVIDLGQTDAEHALLAAWLDRYQPARGDPAPVIVLRRGAQLLADMIRRQRANLVLLSADSRSRTDETEFVGLLREILAGTSADLVLAYDRGLRDVNRILFATSGGPSAQAAAPFVYDLVRSYEADLHVLFVASPDDPDPHDTAYQRIAQTLAGIDLDESFTFQRRVLVDRNPPAAIISEAANYDLLVIGGSVEGWRTRLRLDSLSTKIARNVAATTLVTFSHSVRPRPWWSRLFG